MSVDLHELKAQISRLFASYPNAVVAKETIAVYFEMLSDIPIEHLKLAINQALVSSKFLPTIAEIRSMAVSLATPEIPSATTAWAEVKSKLPHVLYGDAITKPKLSNPIAAQVADALGWRNLYFNQGYLERRFITAYNDAVDRQQSYALLPPDVRQFKEQTALKQLCSSVQNELEREAEKVEGE